MYRNSRCPLSTGLQFKCGGAKCACPVDTVATLQTINTDAGPKAIHVVCVYVCSVNSRWVQYYSTTNVYGIYPWNYFGCEQQLALALRKRQIVDITASGRTCGARGVVVVVCPMRLSQSDVQRHVYRSVAADNAVNTVSAIAE